MRSWFRSGVFIAVLGLAVLGAPQAPAQEEDAEASQASGDPQRGGALANTCLGCHGVQGYKNAQPVYHVPKLEGQHAEYIVLALQAYRAGERSHLTMHSQASSLSDQDMADIAAYFAAKPVQSGNEPEGSAPKAAETCVACHGNDGVGITGMYPTLSGQHADYLVRALTDYKTGARKNPIMATFAQQLSAADIRALAEYYSQQQPALQTVERPYSVLTAER